jgi:type II secretory pathway component PulJ
MNRLAQLLRRDDGMTVTELLVGTSIFVIIVFAVFSVLDSGTTAERGQQARHDTLLETRAAMTRMSKDIRQAVSLSPTSTRSRLQVQTYISGTALDVIYELNANDQITRKIGTTGPATPIIERVTTDTPFCYDPDSACTATTPSTALSKVRINLSVQPDVSNARAITLATDIELRNI